MNLVTRRSWYFGSGLILRLGTSRRRGMVFSQIQTELLGTLRAVFRTALATVVDTDGIERAADDVVANAGEILHTAAADEHHAVLLEVVAFARDVRGDFETVGQTDA